MNFKRTLLQSALTFLIMLLLCPVTRAQVIPNGNFESWVLTPLFTYEPEFWASNNTELAINVVQDSISYEGEFSMKVSADSMIGNEVGRAWINVSIESMPSMLDFYVKYERSGALVSVKVWYFNEEEFLSIDSWSASGNESDWMPVNLPLESPQPEVTDVRIEVVVEVGDAFPGYGWLLIDSMSFDGVNGIDVLSNPTVGLYPIPASDMLFVKEADERTSYVIYDSMGKLLERDAYHSGVDVSELPVGNYFIEVLTADGVLRRSGFVVE